MRSETNISWDLGVCISGIVKGRKQRFQILHKTHQNLQTWRWKKPVHSFLKTTSLSGKSTGGLRKWESNIWNLGSQFLSFSFKLKLAGASVYLTTLSLVCLLFLKAELLKGEEKFIVAIDKEQLCHDCFFPKDIHPC